MALPYPTCDTRSLRISGLMTSTSVPGRFPPLRAFSATSRCEARGKRPKGSPNHPDQPGQGKKGWVNANEPSRRLRYPQLPERWLIKTAIMGPGQNALSLVLWNTQGLRSREGTQTLRS